MSAGVLILSFRAFRWSIASLLLLNFRFTPCSHDQMHTYTYIHGAVACCSHQLIFETCLGLGKGTADSPKLRKYIKVALSQNHSACTLKFRVSSKSLPDPAYVSETNPLYAWISYSSNPNCVNNAPIQLQRRFWSRHYT